MSDATRAAAEFTRLVEIMATLRGPDGCPWDREQTIDYAEAVRARGDLRGARGDRPRTTTRALCEELGDFVFEAVFLAQLESEAGHFTIADSLKSIADKLVRRHPHVFARDAGEAGARLGRPGADALGGDQGAGTRRQRPSRRRCSSGIAAGAARAAARVPHRHPRRVGRLRLERAPRDVVAKIQEEVDELREVVDGAGRRRPGARRRGDGRPAVLDREPVAASSASSPRPRCARRTTSSRRRFETTGAVGRRTPGER